MQLSGSCRGHLGEQLHTRCKSHWVCVQNTNLLFARLTSFDSLICWICTCIHRAITIASMIFVCLILGWWLSIRVQAFHFVIDISSELSEMSVCVNRLQDRTTVLYYHSICLGWVMGVSITNCQPICSWQASHLGDITKRKKTLMKCCAWWNHQASPKDVIIVIISTHLTVFSNSSTVNWLAN